MRTTATVINRENLIQDSYNEDSFKTLTIGTTDCNYFMPVFAIGAHKLLVFRDEEKEEESTPILIEEEKEKKEEAVVLEYSMPIVGSNLPFRTYPDLIYSFINANSIRSFVFKIEGNIYTINVIRGIIYDSEGDILMCLAVETDYILNVSVEDFKSSTNFSNFVLLISKKLDLPIYKNVKRKLQNLYVNNAIEEKVDIIICEDPKRWLFKNNYEKRKFKSIKEMQTYLNDEVPKEMVKI